MTLPEATVPTFYGLYKLGKVTNLNLVICSDFVMALLYRVPYFLCQPVSYSKLKYDQSLMEGEITSWTSFLWPFGEKVTVP